MLNTKFAAVFLALALLPLLLFSQDQPKSPSQQPAPIGYQTAADAEQKKTLLLKDFQPHSMLHLAAHDVNRAKFYVIDVHNHTNDAARIEEHMPPARVLEVMNSTNVKTVVILTGMWGDKLQRVIDEMVKPYPGRFMVFTQLDWSKIDDPNFSEEMVTQLDDAVTRGARGLKFLKDFGLGVRDKSGKLIAIDDNRLNPVWEECGRLGIPVFIHTGDPEAFFHPIDGTNERYEELIEHPDWSFFGPEFPRLRELLEARNRVFAKHPKTTFVSLHMGWPENLDWVAQMLDEHPNVMVEFGAREAELGRQRLRTRELFLKYQDRILFGTDSGMDEAMYRNYFRWLETNDEDFDYWGYPGQGRWEIDGMGLPDAVLEKVYHGNAEKLFQEFMGTKGGKYDADGIYCDGCGYTTIENNLIMQVDYGIEVTSEHKRCLANGTEWPGAYYQGTPATGTSPCNGNWVTVRNNVFYNANACGMSFGGYANNVGGSAHDVYVNNTLYNSATQPGIAPTFRVRKKNDSSAGALTSTADFTGADKIRAFCQIAIQRNPHVGPE